MSTYDDEDRDYEVGYGRPPEGTRFRKGQSGNPKGRPKAAKGLTASLKRELASQITVREGSREIRISKAEALAKRLVEKALKGDIAAIRMLVSVDAEALREIEAQAVADAGSPEPDVGDLEILRHFAELARSDAWDPDKTEGPE